MPLELSEWGKFVTKYGATVPINLWQAIRFVADQMIEHDADWQVFFHELSQGCIELGENERLLEIMAIEENESLNKQERNKS